MASPYGKIVGRVSLAQGVHPETVAISNSLSRMAGGHRGVRAGGGHFNELLPSNLKNTDACSSQPETVARVKLRKLAALPDILQSNAALAPRRVH